MTVYFIIIGLSIGSVIGYILGLKIWDLYYNKIILPKIIKEEKEMLTLFHNISKLIGNPIDPKLSMALTAEEINNV